MVRVNAAAGYRSGRIVLVRSGLGVKLVQPSHYFRGSEIFFFKGPQNLWGFRKFLPGKKLRRFKRRVLAVGAGGLIAYRPQGDYNRHY